MVHVHENYRCKRMFTELIKADKHLKKIDIKRKHQLHVHT